ncbi:AAA domain-containing protein [Metamycoplasma spumans]|uniref:DEAD/DEAH box helicase n=1 Tax=Metamycoplasma spumans TaxID=92406 RepID=UPI0034DD366A
MNKKDIKYQTIMANLLNIDTFDTSLYSAVDNEKFFDVYKNFGEKTFDNILNNYRIDTVLTEIGNQELAKKVLASLSKQDVINSFKEYERRIDDNIFKLLSSDLEKAKRLIVNKLDTEFQKSIVKWKKILNKAQNVNIESNIWPLHIGFFFISIKTEKKTIFAPLFFKEITLEIKNSLVYLKSNSDIRVNSKLITFLGQEGFMLNVDNYDFANLSIQEVFDFFKKEWAPIYKTPENLKDKLPSLTQDTIIHSSIEFHPGMVLGFYNVSSGYLWNQMKKIIENDEFEYILNPEINKTIYQDKVKRVIFDNKFKLFKIQKTNFSQDVATISALYQDTIIWGPPGTGKSQTISNLIANIIARGYSGLVVSQKKAALDVLKNRLKKLSIFCLFALNDKNLRDEVFYKPLREFIEYVENFRKNDSQEGIQIFSNDDKNYVDTVKKIKGTKNLNNIINFYSSIINYDLSQQEFESLKLLGKELKYNFEAPLNDKKEIRKVLYEINKDKKAGVFTIYPKNIKESADILFENPNLFKIDINNAIKYVDLVDYESIKEFENDYKNILDKKTIEVNDDIVLTKMVLQQTINKMSNFDKEELRQYNAFAMAIRTGHLKPYKFFHKHKEMIKKLFPIIVTTPELDLSMWEKGEFDYAILDESSQIFIEKGIPILYLAKRKILAGDNQQMQPTRWFSVSYNFDEEDDFGNIESLLDYAKARGVYSILLDKNYRSKQASLMTFSSKHFYNSKLDVIDDYSLSISKNKAIEVIQVNGSWDNSMNEAEGKEVIQIAKDNLDKYNKIIILVFNAKQQDYLINCIFGNEPRLEEALNKDKLVLKNIENIQGDEADLVIMSVVYDKNTALYGTYVARQGGKNALNVAISRAREKVIVVKSIYADDIEITERSTTDMVTFKEWLKFLDLSLEEQKNYLDETEDFLATKTISLGDMSEFKNDVFVELNEFISHYSDLKLQTNYSIGTKTIDIVLINVLSNKLVQGFIIDNYNYANGELDNVDEYKKYLKFKDNLKFLDSKSYPIIILSEILWPINKYKILSYIKNKIEDEILSNANLKLNEKILQRQILETTITAEFDNIENPNLIFTTEIDLSSIDESKLQVNNFEVVNLNKEEDVEMSNENKTDENTLVNSDIEDYEDIAAVEGKNNLAHEEAIDDFENYHEKLDIDKDLELNFDDEPGDFKALEDNIDNYELEINPHVDNDNEIHEPELDYKAEKDIIEESYTYSDADIMIEDIIYNESESEVIEVNESNDFNEEIEENNIEINVEEFDVDEKILNYQAENNDDIMSDPQLHFEESQEVKDENSAEINDYDQVESEQLSIDDLFENDTNSNEFIGFSELFGSTEENETGEDNISKSKSASELIDEFSLTNTSETTTEFEVFNGGEDE